jgi:hypothetical protein
MLYGRDIDCYKDISPNTIESLEIPSLPHSWQIQFLIFAQCREALSCKHNRPRAEVSRWGILSPRPPKEALHHNNMSTPLERVQHLLVTPDNPPIDSEALDVQRCVELHNAILEHGWLSSGRSAKDFQSQCTPYYERAAEEIDEKCSASLKSFFQGARNVPAVMHRFNFFYNVSQLDCAFGWHDYYTQEENRVLRLYTVSAGLYGDPDGLL